VTSRRALVTAAVAACIAHAAARAQKPTARRVGVAYDGKVSQTVRLRADRFIE
jgi:hypothetical protein